MSIDQVISLAASIGACLSSIAAFIAVHLSSKHSKDSYKPELLIARTHFKSIASGGIPCEWINESVVEEEESYNMMFSVPLLNVGLGAAKEVLINWSFTIEDLVSKVNILAQKSLISAYFEYGNEILSLRSESRGCRTSIWKNQQKQTVDFVLPAPVVQVPYKLVLPLAYTQLVSALIYFAAKSGSLEALTDIPPLKASLSYFDIGGSKHEKKFLIMPNVNVIKNECEEFNGYVEGRNA